MADRRHWFVYGLYDARNKRRPFYIGMTRDLTGRARRHRYIKGLAYARICKINAAGSYCVLRSLARFGTRKEAGCYERQRIAATPALMNVGATKTVRGDFAFLPHSLVEVRLSLAPRVVMSPAEIVAKREAHSARKEQARVERAARFAARRRKRTSTLYAC